MGKCKARFIKKKSASKKVIYDPVDVRISVSTQASGLIGVRGGGGPDLPDPFPGSTTG